MHLTILSSGSAGNLILLSSGGSHILIDAGLKGRNLWQRFLLARTPETTDPATPPASAAFLTHEHGDHICGAEELAERGLTLYATPGTAGAARLSRETRGRIREVQPGEPVTHEAFVVHPVSIPHDAAQPVGYVIADGTARLGVLTDCGHPAAHLAQGFADCDALVLETNHDRRMLIGGPYPARLKQRIASGTGHLSNDQSATLLRAILAASSCWPRLVVCAHLSKTNNRPDLARAALSQVLDGQPVELLVAEQDRPMAPIDLSIDRSERLARSRRRPGIQLSLRLCATRSGGG